MKNRLQEIRWKKDWSLTKLSKKSGVPKPTITLIENGNTNNPRIIVLDNLYLIHINIFQMLMLALKILPFRGIQKVYLMESIL